MSKLARLDSAKRACQALHRSRPTNGMTALCQAVNRAWQDEINRETRTTTMKVAQLQQIVTLFRIMTDAARDLERVAGEAHLPALSIALIDVLDSIDKAVGVVQKEQDD